jgi:cytochrome P450
MCITGRSILFADTDQEWSKRRKALSPAFYKGKLLTMINLAKQSMQGTLDRWTTKANAGNGTV